MRRTARLILITKLSMFGFCNYMKISPISFGSNNLVYARRAQKEDRLMRISCHTSMFRNDMDWRAFSYTLDNYFKDSNQVFIINGACSDGSEPYTLSISLLRNLDNESALKFFPINAYDCNEFMIDAVLGGYINFTHNDVAALRNVLGNKMDECFVCCKNPPRNSMEKFKEKNTTTYEVTKNLRQLVDFRCGNVLDVLGGFNDKSENIVFMFRNALPYLSTAEREKLFELIDKKLGKNCVIVFGGFDNNTYGSYIDAMARKSGFTNKVKNGNSLIYLK